MSYEKHTWQSQEIITAEKLNNIESGIEEANSGSDSSSNCIIVTGVFTIDGDDISIYDMSHTPTEVKTALDTNMFVILKLSNALTVEYKFFYPQSIISSYNIVMFVEPLSTVNASYVINIAAEYQSNTWMAQKVS